MLFNKHLNPALVESDKNRQIYDLTTNSGDCRLYIKYRADKQQTKTKDYNSWQFVFTSSEINELENYLHGKLTISMILVCGVDGLAESEIAILDSQQISKIFSLDKTSITISRRKKEKSYRVSVGGGRDCSLQVKTNRFDDIFKDSI